MSDSCIFVLYEKLPLGRLLSERKNMFTSMPRIPEEYVLQTPCLINPSIFTDPALDVDIDDESWTTLSRAEQDERLEAKEAAENRARAACKLCPRQVFESCEKTDQESEIKAFGVLAGKTYEERMNPGLVLTEDHLIRDGRGQVSDDTIVYWRANGLSNHIIAKRLGVTSRTVERRFAAIAANPTMITKYSGVSKSSPKNTDKTEVSKVKVARRAAANPLQPGRVTRESAALYDLLLGGEFRDRSEVIDALIDNVERDDAYSRAPKDREYADEEARIRIGARKFLMNRIDIAVRAGRILEAKNASGKKIIALEPSTIQVWSNWRASENEYQRK